MALLRINWRNATQVAPTAAATGDAEDGATARTTMRLDRPLLVYVTSDDPNDSNTRKLEDVVFANESVAVGAKFFDTVRMSPGDVLQDRLLKEAGEKTPRLIFVARDYDIVDVLESKSQLSAGKIVKSMSRLAKKEYENSFAKMVRGYIKLLNDLDRLDGKRANLEMKRQKLAEKPSPSKQRKLERDQAEYEKEMEEWKKEEQELLAFKLKGEKPEA